MQEPVLNIATGAAILTFKDGVRRNFDLNVEAMILAEELAGASVFNPAAAFIWSSARGIRALLYGGLRGDAVARGETWTPGRLAGLMEPADLPALDRLCGWALRIKMLGPEAVRLEGETTATEKKKATAKPSRGVGRKHSRLPAST